MNFTYKLQKNVYIHSSEKQFFHKFPETMSKWQKIELVQNQKLQWPSHTCILLKKKTMQWICNLLIFIARKGSLQRLCFHRCLSIHRGVCVADIPWADTILGQTSPPWTDFPWGDTPTGQCMLGHSQQAGGMHPTGMHSCYHPQTKLQ